MGKSRHFAITESKNLKSAIFTHKDVVIITHEQNSNCLRCSEECKRLAKLGSDAEGNNTPKYHIQVKAKQLISFVLFS